MITISLCMIVKNEEKTLPRCLESVGEVADEIIIMDTGSTDATKEIASRFTNKIYDFAWIDDFSAARNAAFDRATQEYVLWLDADDILRPEDREKFLTLKRTLAPDVDAVMMLYNTGFDVNGEVTFSYYRERLSRRDKGFRWVEPVHEYLQISGKIINSDISITHGKELGGQRTGRNLKIYENRLARGEALSPRGMYYYARELKDNQRYEDSARQFGAFLDSRLGWVEDNITACGDQAGCYHMLGEPEKELASLFRSFSFATPRGEICCRIGYYFKDKNHWQEALFWFKLVLSLQKPKDSWGFIQHDSWGYVPALECAVCLDRLGQYEQAEQFNEMAAGYKPDSAAVKMNREYFQKKKSIHL